MRLPKGAQSDAAITVPDVTVSSATSETVNANSLKAYAARSVNLSASSLADGDSFTHSLNSTKLCVSFYDASGIQQFDIRWAPNGVNAIYIYLPLLESGTNTFTGEIFIQKRA